MLQPTPHRNTDQQSNPVSPANPEVFVPRPPGSPPDSYASSFQIETPHAEVPSALVKFLYSLETSSLYQLLGIIYMPSYEYNLFPEAFTKGILSSPFSGDGSSNSGSPGENPLAPPPPGGDDPDDPFVKKGRETFLSLREKLRNEN
jgi:hypothetical protein